MVGALTMRLTHVGCHWQCLPMDAQSARAWLPASHQGAPTPTGLCTDAGYETCFLRPRILTSTTRRERTVPDRAPAPGDASGRQSS